MATIFAAVKQTKLLALIDAIDWYTGNCYFVVPKLVRQGFAVHWKNI